MTVSRQTETAAALRLQIEFAPQGIAWRKRVYGQVCLTQREYECVVLSMHYTTNVAIAARMRIDKSRVTRLLQKARLILAWMEGHGIEFGWEQTDGVYHFVCPHAVTMIAYEAM